MGKRPPYTIEDPKTGRLSYRRRYPADLRPFIPAKDGEKSAWEFRETLKATKFSDAVWARYHAAAAKYGAIEREARQRAAGGSQPLDPAIIQFLADTYLATEIEHTNRSRRALPGTDVEDLRPYPARPDLEGDWEASVELFGDREDPPGPIDVPGMVAMWGAWCQTFARSYGYVVDPNGHGFSCNRTQSGPAYSSLPRKGLSQPLNGRTQHPLMPHSEFLIWSHGAKRKTSRTVFRSRRQRSPLSTLDLQLRLVCRPRPQSCCL